MFQGYDKFVELAMKAKPKNPEDVLRVKKTVSKKLGLPIPTNADLREIYNNLAESGKIKPDKNFEESLFSRKIRTQSGVAVIAVLTKPYPCPGKCLYCPSEKDMPKSYLSNEPAVMRAIAANFDPYQQVQNRIRALELNGHKTDKVELIVMGGTFSYLPKNYQKRFIAECFRACNNYPEKNNKKGTLEKEQKKNESARHRIVGLTLETRPDYITPEEIVNFRNLGCTRVELGVQSIFDEILKFNRRGHDNNRTIEATKLLRDAGFKISYHIMPGLPGSDIKKDHAMFKKMFSDPDYQPDLIKIYPTIVERSSELYKLWRAGKYEAITDKEFKKFILSVKKKIIPPYVRISRLIRDVPTTSILAGPVVSNLRQIISDESGCQCIRCREVKADYNFKEKMILDRIDYDASGGKEIFLQYVSPDKKKLFALLRLRIPEGSAFGDTLKVEPSDNYRNMLNIIQNTAIIREVHTYGKMAGIDKKDKKSPQHEGLGKRLITEAEKIARQEFGLNKFVVISGIGVRGYYRKLGYRLKDSYMVKSI